MTQEKVLRKIYNWLNLQRTSVFVGEHPSEIQALIMRTLEESENSNPSTKPPERGGFVTQNIQDGETVCIHGSRPFECVVCRRHRDCSSVGH